MQTSKTEPRYFISRLKYLDGDLLNWNIFTSAVSFDIMSVFTFNNRNKTTLYYFLNLQANTQVFVTVLGFVMYLTLFLYPREKK